MRKAKAKELQSPSLPSQVSIENLLSSRISLKIMCQILFFQLSDVSLCVKN